MHVLPRTQTLRFHQAISNDSHPSDPTWAPGGKSSHPSHETQSDWFNGCRTFSLQGSVRNSANSIRLILGNPIGHQRKHVPVLNTERGSVEYLNAICTTRPILCEDETRNYTPASDHATLMRWRSRGAWLTVLQKPRYIINGCPRLRRPLTQIPVSKSTKSAGRQNDTQINHSRGRFAVRFPLGFCNSVVSLAAFVPLSPLE